MTDATGRSIDLGLMSSGDFCDAFAVNEAQQVVGAASVSKGGSARAFLWEGGRFRNLGLLPGGSTSQAGSINRQGHVVGGADVRPSGPSHAFLWSGGALKDIGDDDRYLSTVANFISDKGEIVGSGQGAKHGKSHALRFAEGGVIDLESEVEELADWNLERAVSVNDDGVVAGYGTRLGGSGTRVEHAFKLIPLARRQDGMADRSGSQ